MSTVTVNGFGVIIFRHFESANRALPAIINAYLMF